MSIEDMAGAAFRSTKVLELKAGGKVELAHLKISDLFTMLTQDVYNDQTYIKLTRVEAVQLRDHLDHLIETTP